MSDQLTAADMIATLKRLESLTSRDQRFDDLLLNMNTTLGDMHEHQVGQAQSILTGLCEAIKNIKFDVPVVNVNMPTEAGAEAASPSAWSSLNIKVNNDMHGNMESFTVTKVA